jgi:release factor glutamine methyltransferase
MAATRSNAAPTIAAALLQAATRIDRAEAVTLLCFAIKQQRTFIYAHSEQPLTRVEAASFDTLVGARAMGMPVAYLLGEREFYGRSFKSDRRALIPRPETELLVEVALEVMKGYDLVDALDLGTGTGIIAITLMAERPHWAMTAVDVSNDALELAKLNASQLLSGPAIRWLQSSWFQSLQNQNFDLIVSNPPYIANGDAHLLQGDLRFEPRWALESGTDGLEAIRLIIANASVYLKAAGWLVLEHGYDQGDTVRELLIAEKFTNVVTRSDLANIPRVTFGQFNPS